MGHGTRRGAPSRDQRWAGDGASAGTPRIAHVADSEDRRRATTFLRIAAGLEDPSAANALRSASSSASRRLLMLQEIGLTSKRPRKGCGRPFASASVARRLPSDRRIVLATPSRRAICCGMVPSLLFIVESMAS